VQVTGRAPRTSEGIRRLAILLGITGAALGAFRSKPRFESIEHQRWHFAYFSEQRKAHPKARIKKRGREVALVEMPAPVDYDALARQAGAIVAPPASPVTWTVSDKPLARQAGAIVPPPVKLPPGFKLDAPAAPTSQITLPPGFTLDKTTQRSSDPWAAASEVPITPNDLGGGWTLDPPGTPIYEQAFEAGADAPPAGFEYVLLALPAVLGFLFPWGSIHAIVWVVRGFRLDRATP
jgi:hypothetical protein